MKKTRRILIRLIALAAVIALSVVLAIIGRGHTVYFDNKPMEYNGEKYDCPYQIEVLVNNASAGKVKEGDRGMVDTMGQDFSMILAVTPEKGAKRYGLSASFKIPYNLDGVVINLPALMAGAPQDVYMSEFVPVAVKEDEDANVVITDEFELPLGE